MNSSKPASKSSPFPYWRKPVDTKEIFSAVGNFGFPMVLSWYLLLRMEQRLDKLTGCLNELSKALLKNNNGH